MIEPVPLATRFILVLVPLDLLVFARLIRAQVGAPRMEHPFTNAFAYDGVRRTLDEIGTTEERVARDRRLAAGLAAIVVAASSSSLKGWQQEGESKSA